jgi:hypothetical protein
MHVLKLSQIWAQYTAVWVGLQLLLPALAAAADLSLSYRSHDTELSVENKLQLAELLSQLEAKPGLKLHLVTTSPASAADHTLGAERLAWINAFFKERNLDLTPRVKSTTYLYSAVNNPSVMISW